MPNDFFVQHIIDELNHAFKLFVLTIKIILHLELVTQSLKVLTYRMHRPQVFSAQIDCWCQVDMQMELGAINAMRVRELRSLSIHAHSRRTRILYLFMNWINL